MRGDAGATLAALVALFGAGCGAEIGDPCETNVDCSPEGDRKRICDRSLPGGYCTIEGCDEGTCPDDSVCVRFFPVNGLTRACVQTSDCAADEICLSDGFCALRVRERRFCMRACGHDHQCRDGYECRRTGFAGAEAAQAPDDPEAFEADLVDRFCGPPVSR
jgi:hypothetical protein